MLPVARRVAAAVAVAAALLLPGSSESRAAPPDLPKLTGQWNGKEGCMTGAFSVQAKLAPPGKSFRLSYRAKPIGDEGKSSSGAIDIEPQEARLKITYHLPPGGPLPVDSLDGFADLAEGKDGRTSFTTDFGLLNAMARAKGWFRITDKDRRLEFEVELVQPGSKDRCKGVLRRRKGTAKK